MSRGVWYFRGTTYWILWWYSDSTWIIQSRNVLVQDALEQRRYREQKLERNVSLLDSTCLRMVQLVHVFTSKYDRSLLLWSVEPQNTCLKGDRRCQEEPLDECIGWKGRIGIWGITHRFGSFMNYKDSGGCFSRFSSFFIVRIQFKWNNTPLRHI